MTRGSEDPAALDRHYAEALDLFLRVLLQVLTSTATERPGEGWSGDWEVHLQPLVSSILSSNSPYDVVSDLYEDLMRYRPHRDRTTGMIRLECSEARRKASGSFYTPRPLADSLVSAALEPVVEKGRGALPRVLDPAMGSGVFLLSAAHLLARRLRLPLKVVAENCLYGIDLDPHAVELALTFLAWATGASRQRLAGHIGCGDGLGEILLQGQENFDAVVGNPPWGARYSQRTREHLTERFLPAVHRSFDSFKLFLARGTELSGGTVGMILPQAVVSHVKHADVRQIVLDRMAPYFGARVPGHPFRGTAAPACLLVFGPRPGPSHVVCGHPLISASWTGLVPSHLWSASRFCLQNPDIAALLLDLQDRHPPLGELTHLYRVRDTGINYNRAAIARRVLYIAPARRHPDDCGRYRGGCFARYTGIRPDGWIRHNARDLLQPGETLSVDRVLASLPEKIVLRQTADCIVATVDRTHMVMGRSVIAITQEAGVSLYGLLACLNSRLFTVLYRCLVSEAGSVFPQVKVGQLKALPLPEVCATTEPLPVADLDELEGHAVVDRAAGDPVFAWSCLDHLARRLIDAEGQNSQAEILIDSIIYRLYGLSATDISAVERQTPGGSP